MTLYSAEFNLEQFELRGQTDYFVSEEQKVQITNLADRVPAQLDWLAQLLGWNGTNYWSSFSASIDQKRQLLAGSYGVFNGYIYPEIVEVRNWTDSVIIKDNPFISENQTFLLGGVEYYPKSIEKEGDNLSVNFEGLSEQFYEDIGLGSQLRVTASRAIPKPFKRDKVGVSGDRSFTCQILEDTNIVLYPDYDTEKTLPYELNTFFLGSRYYFDLPVSLLIGENYYVEPIYDFDRDLWYIDIPCDLTDFNAGSSAQLSAGEASLIVSLKEWSDPSDWLDEKTIQYFKGAWANKGGYLPFNLAFDSLSIHGFDPKKSVLLRPITRQIPFDKLLNFVYQQKTKIDSLPPNQENQVWWNSSDKTFYVYKNDPPNCGPWVPGSYPQGIQESFIINYVFPDVPSFTSYSSAFEDGDTVKITNCFGLGPGNSVLGITQTLTSPGEVILVWNSKIQGWVANKFTYLNESDFSTSSQSLPPDVTVEISDSTGLIPETANYVVENLKIAISGKYPTYLRKFEGDYKWYLSPPPHLKYIGNTRLFASSLNWDKPVEGEMAWDYSNPNFNTRGAYIFYYDSWVQNIITSEWELSGNWYNVNTGAIVAPPGDVFNYDTLLFYCDGEILTENITSLTENYQITYSFDSVNGVFSFSYFPSSGKGGAILPRITVSDSLTSSFRWDITDLVFSGLEYYMSPNVDDSETLLRLWKGETLFCVSEESEINSLSYPNSLVAGSNLGPSDGHWERYFIRLPPDYERNGPDWQKVNLICQDFGYWGTSTLPETMPCPEQKEEVAIYDELVISRDPSKSNCIYSEPYLYSNSVPEFGYSDDYDNSAILPSFDDPRDSFDEAYLLRYDPLHERRADTDSPMGRGYGDWLGSYYRLSECSDLTGHVTNDILLESLEELFPPIWDSSMYKFPQTCILDEGSSYVDMNHFVLGYSLFAAGLSAAGEPCFNITESSNSPTRVNALPIILPFITLTVFPSSIPEGGGGVVLSPAYETVSDGMVFTFTRSGPTDEGLIVNYIVEGTAIPGVDYTGIDPGEGLKSIIFESGSSTATIVVIPIADSESEGDETIILTIQNSAFYQLGDPFSATGTILGSPCNEPPYFCNTDVNPYCVEDFSDAWANCVNLTSFPLLDVSSGTNFYATWFNCVNLTSFPLLDVSSGTNFYATWLGCNSLTTFPAGMFNACLATDFTIAWYDCALNQQSVDNILISLDTAGQINGTVHVNGGASASPSFTGWAAVSSLEAKGWTVYVNGTPPPPCDSPPYNCNTNVNPYCVTNFSSAWYNCSSLTSFPELDTSSGVNFSFTWYGCSGLTSFPEIDVSSGTNFRWAWAGCTSLTSFPELDVSSGTNFNLTWQNCTSLTTFPELDVSSGTNFENTWRDCINLTSFPELDVSSGTNFEQTWYNCSGLTTFPLLDVSSGTNFEATWYNCSSLTSFPELDVSSGTFFASSWAGCSSLTTFPLLNVSSGTYFGSSWAGCSSLTTFPFLNVSSGTYFESAWAGCSSLTSFPILDVSNGTNFNSTWSGCNNLTTFPLLNVSSGTYFGNAWSDCSSLTTFPVLNVSSGTDFKRAWHNCTSLTTFPQLNVSSGIDFSYAWGGCSSLTTFPLLNVSQGTNFEWAWYNCTSLTTFPTLDVSSGIYFNFTWYNCSSLTSFPAGMFDTCLSTDFVWAWKYCALDQQSVDNILISLDTAGQINGIVNVDGGISASPSGLGIIARDNLISKGWTVFTN